MLNIYAALLFSIFATNLSFAQSTTKNENIKVWGNCGMCKNTIEKAAKAGGATVADWNEKTKFLNVSYNPSISNSDRIQKAIAISGYDTQNFKADDKGYNKLMSCCKYARHTASATTITSKLLEGCKNTEACKNKPCYKNGKCDVNLCKSIPECRSSCCKS